MLVREPAGFAAAIGEIRFRFARGKLFLCCLPEREAGHRKKYSPPGLILHNLVVDIC